MEYRAYQHVIQFHSQMEVITLLDSEKAKLLEANIIDRIKKLHPDNEQAVLLRLPIIRTIIIALQEYERLKDGQ